MAIDIDETDRAEPLQLCLDVEQLVRGIFFTGPNAQAAQEVLVQRIRR